MTDAHSEHETDPNAEPLMVRRAPLEKLQDAVCSLCTGSGRLQDRLGNVYICHLAYLEPTDVPPAVRDEMVHVLYAMATAPGDSQELKIMNTMCEMPDDLARLIASQIFKVYDHFARTTGLEADRGRPPASPSPQPLEPAGPQA